MSDIDLISHLRIGQFGRVPLYLCLEDGCWFGKMPLEPSSVAIKNSICIGGGSGEHPAAVINEPWKCVNAFVSNDESVVLPEIIFCDQFSEEDWKRRFFYEFEPYAEIMSFKRWMSECVGEFLFFMLPDLDQRIANLRDQNPDIVEPSYEQIAIPWFPYCGRRDYWRIVKTEQAAPSNGGWRSSLNSGFHSRRG